MAANSRSLQAAPLLAMEEVTAGLGTKSDKIRALSKAGYSRSEIADFLGIRYAHVRNVLVNDARVASGGTSSRGYQAPAGNIPAPSTAGKKGELLPTKVRVEPDGRVAIPLEFLRAAGLKENDPAILTFEDDELRLASLPVSVRRAQAIVRKFVPEGVSLVDELLAERRLEAQREDDNG